MDAVCSASVLSHSVHAENRLHGLIHQAQKAGGVVVLDMRQVQKLVSNVRMEGS